jgi:hypothetical protein
MKNLRAQSAWRAAVAAALLNTLGSPFDLVVGRHVLRMPRLPVIACAAAGLVVLVVLLGARRRRPLWLSSSAFLVNTVAITAMLWVTDTSYATTAHWVPYQSTKLGALTVALLAPELWAGVLSLLAFIGSALLHYHWLPPNLRANVFGEPGSTVAFGVFAMAVYAAQLSRHRLDRDRLKARADADSLERLNMSYSAIRDLANTPLQTIELSVALLRKQHPDLAARLQPIDRSLAQLQKLNQILDAAAAAGHGLPEYISPKGVPANQGSGRVRA